MRFRPTFQSSFAGGFAKTIAGFLLLTGRNVCQAATEAQSGGSPVIQFSDPSYYLQVFGSLIVVIGAIFLLSLAARKFDLAVPKSDGPIQILESMSIGGKEQLLLLQVGGEQILVGRSSGRLEKIHTLSTPITNIEKSTASLVGPGLLARVLNR